MKVSSRLLEHHGFVIAMLAFACMAYSDYSRDGDLVNPASLRFWHCLPSLPPTFTPSIKEKRTKTNNGRDLAIH